MFCFLNFSIFRCCKEWIPFIAIKVLYDMKMALSAQRSTEARFLVWGWPLTNLPFSSCHIHSSKMKITISVTHCKLPLYWNAWRPSSIMLIRYASMECFFPMLMICPWPLDVHISFRHNASSICPQSIDKKLFIILLFIFTILFLFIAKINKQRTFLFSYFLFLYSSLVFILKFFFIDEESFVQWFYFIFLW